MLWNSRHCLHLWNVTDLLITHSHADHLSAVSLDPSGKPEDYYDAERNRKTKSITVNRVREEFVRRSALVEDDAEESFYTLKD